MGAPETSTMESQSSVLTSFPKRCDICDLGDNEDGLGELCKCRQCGVLVHSKCYGIRSGAGMSAFVCYACQAIGKHFEIVEQHANGHHLRIHQEERPTDCAFCSVRTGTHAMHPLFDKHGEQGKPILLDNGRLAWVHTLCALVIATKFEYVHGCCRDGTNHRSNVGDSHGNASGLEDRAANPNLIVDDSLHHFVYSDDYLKKEQSSLQCSCGEHNSQGAVRRIRMQCCAGNCDEYPEFESTHVSLGFRSCADTLHVGCARWCRFTGIPDWPKRVFFHPGAPGYHPIAEVYCSTHAEDVANTWYVSRSRRSAVCCLQEEICSHKGQQQVTAIQPTPKDVALPLPKGPEQMCSDKNVTDLTGAKSPAVLQEKRPSTIDSSQPVEEGVAGPPRPARKVLDSTGDAQLPILQRSEEAVNLCVYYAVTPSPPTSPSTRCQLTALDCSSVEALMVPKEQPQTRSTEKPIRLPSVGAVAAKEQPAPRGFSLKDKNSGSPSVANQQIICRESRGVNGNASDQRSDAKQTGATSSADTEPTRRPNAMGQHLDEGFPSNRGNLPPHNSDISTTRLVAGSNENFTKAAASTLQSSQKMSPSLMIGAAPEVHLRTNSEICTSSLSSRDQQKKVDELRKMQPPEKTCAVQRRTSTQDVICRPSGRPRANRSSQSTASKRSGVTTNSPGSTSGREEHHGKGCQPTNAHVLPELNARASSPKLAPLAKQERQAPAGTNYGAKRMKIHTGGRKTRPQVVVGTNSLNPRSSLTSRGRTEVADRQPHKIELAEAVPTSTNQRSATSIQTGGRKRKDRLNRDPPKKTMKWGSSRNDLGITVSQHHGGSISTMTATNKSRVGQINSRNGSANERSYSRLFGKHLFKHMGVDQQEGARKGTRSIMSKASTPSSFANKHLPNAPKPRAGKSGPNIPHSQPRSLMSGRQQRAAKPHTTSRRQSQSSPTKGALQPPQMYVGNPDLWLKTPIPKKARK